MLRSASPARLGCPLFHWLVQKHDPLLMGLPVWGEGDDLSLCSLRGMSGRPQGLQPTVGLPAPIKTNRFHSVYVSDAGRWRSWLRNPAPDRMILVYLHDPVQTWLYGEEMPPVGEVACADERFRSGERRRKDLFNCHVIGPDREAGTLPNEIGSNKKKQSELICCSGEFSVSQKSWPRLGIHHCGKSDSVLILNGL